MVSALFSYTLPVLQIVCQLVPTGNSTTGETTPGVLLTTPNLVVVGNVSTDGTTLNTTIEPRYSIPARTLPPGYVAHPDLGVAYKVYNERVTWYVANARCAQEGAHLGIIDSFAKLELVRSQPAAVDEPVHVGFQVIEGDDTSWYSVKTGLPVANLPWTADEPTGSGLCAAISGFRFGLAKWHCTDSHHYVCEIPYP